MLLLSVRWYLADPPLCYCLTFARSLSTDVYFSRCMYKYLLTLSYSISQLLFIINEQRVVVFCRRVVKDLAILINVDVNKLYYQVGSCVELSLNI
jgi:hypothetical protein